MEMLRGVLEEELANSRRRIFAFMKALKELLKGSLHEKEIHGKKYFYRVCWNPKAKRNVFELLSEKPSEGVIASYEKAKAKRASYRNQVRILKLQVQFLERVLRAREFRIAEACSKKAA